MGHPYATGDQHPPVRQAHAGQHTPGQGERRAGDERVSDGIVDLSGCDPSARGDAADDKNPAIAEQRRRMSLPQFEQRGGELHRLAGGIEALDIRIQRVKTIPADQEHGAIFQQRRGV